MTLHRLLSRQMERLQLGSESPPSDIATWRSFLERVGRAYEEMDQERRLVERRVLAASKMAALGEVAGNIAHEINNPLALIRMEVSLLMEMAEQGDLEISKLRELAKEIEGTVERTSSIIQSLRLFAHGGSGDYQPYPLQSIVDDSLKLCRERFKEHGVKVDLRMPSEKILLQCNPIQISQVLINLLNNAYDAIETLENRWIRIEARLEDGGAEISVTDSGPGISAALVGQIFTPLFTTKEVGKGTGLGLSISKRIVEAHGGTLEVDQASPNTRLVVWLPGKP